MDMHRNRKSAGACAAAVAQIVGAATIAAIVSSCSTMGDPLESDANDAASSPASSEELPPAPDIEQLSGEKQASFDHFLSSEGYEDVQFVALAYSENGQEKLIVLQLYGSEEIDPPVDDDEFLIPPVGKNFGEAVVVYSGSPARATTCGRSSGGTRYCNF